MFDVDGTVWFEHELISFAAGTAKPEMLQPLLLALAANNPYDPSLS